MARYRNRVHAGGWIRTAKPAFFATWDFVRFVSESTSLQPSVHQAVGRWYQNWLEPVEAKIELIARRKYDNY